jgi:hypothetical protein
VWSWDFVFDRTDDDRTIKLRETPVLMEQWRVHYNTIRPHSALGYRPPAPEMIVPKEELPMNHEAA